MDQWDETPSHFLPIFRKRSPLLSVNPVTEPTAPLNTSSYSRRPIINCHTHVFTGDHVPPFLARTFLPWPVYYLVPVRPVIWICRLWFEKIERTFRKPAWRKVKQRIYAIRMWIQRAGVINVIVFLVGMALTISTIYIVADWLSGIGGINKSTYPILGTVKDRLSKWGVPVKPEALGFQLLIVLALVIFFKSGRNMVWFVLKKISSFLGTLPGPKSKELARRYMNIGRYAFHRTQEGSWNQLVGQYPEDTAFIVLPMDMEYMGAGSLRKGKEYFHQMEELKKLKTGSDSRFLFPFVFVEPRRIAEENIELKKGSSGRQPIGGKIQLSYTAVKGQVTLGDCFIRDYIESYGFSGFKIYPALGYYPFEEELLPLWKYAADNGLPITTHCIRGNIYYRGPKKSIWDAHPIFKQAAGDKTFDEPLALMETKNIDFINNFTHPMNYLCLLEEKLLRIKVGSSGKDIQDLFGYNGPDTPMDHNLSHLKICMAHFGGDDEWNRFMELDRDLHSRQLVQHPDEGITFLTDRDGNARKGKPEQLWRSVDWYSIICSLMLQYDNVYADLSYILHNSSIHPLLKQTLMNPKLRKRTLFGTDFYVVRNHNSEKGLLAAMIDHLSEEHFDQIAKINPREFLGSRIHGDVGI
jgi:predicted TIM-barrel fold metal-dependent hydrolase